MVKSIKRLSVCLLLLMLCGCHASDRETSDMSGETSAMSEETLAIQTETTEAISQSAASEMVGDAAQDMIYQENIEAVSASERFHCREVTMPEVDGKALYSILGMISEDELLLSMANDGEDGATELGTWTVSSGSYCALAEVEFGAWYLVGIDEDHLFLQWEQPSGSFLPKGAKLWQFTRADKSMYQIFEYAKDADGYAGAYWANQRVLKDGYLYFENLVKNMLGVGVGYAYRYHVERREVEFLGANMQNPMEMDGEVWYIEVHPGADNHKLKNVETGELIELPPHLVDIKSNGEDVMAICILGEDEEEGLSIFGLKNIREQEPVFAVTRHMAELDTNQYFTTWTSLWEDYPMLYDNKEGTVLKLDHLDSGTHYYYLYGSQGVIYTQMYLEEGYQEKFIYIEYIE